MKEEQDDLTLVYMFGFKNGRNSTKDENERLRAALRGVTDAWDWWQVDTYDRCASVMSDAIRDARAALEGEKDNGNN